MLLSDVLTDPIRRKKRSTSGTASFRRFSHDLPAPILEGPADAETTLLGWGSTWGVIKEAAERLTAAGVSVNHLQIKTMIPLHCDDIRGRRGEEPAAHHHREQPQRSVRPAFCGRRPASWRTGTSGNTTASRSSRSTSCPRSTTSSTVKRSSTSCQPSPVGEPTIPPGPWSVGGVETGHQAWCADQGVRKQR